MIKGKWRGETGWVDSIQKPNGDARLDPRTNKKLITKALESPVKRILDFCKSSGMANLKNCVAKIGPNDGIKG